MTSMRTRERLVGHLRALGIGDERVLQRIREVPRHLFVDEALASRAYENTSLPIGHGQTVSQPYIVARMTEALLEGGPLENVLEVGTGSGYQTVVLAPLVRRVFTVERIEALLRQARRRFQGMALLNIRTRHADGGIGWPDYAPFDGILVTAAPPEVPQALIEQLRPGGRMVLPVGSDREQVLVRITRTETGHRSEVLEPVVFVPLLGGVR